MCALLASPRRPRALELAAILAMVWQGVAWCQPVTLESHAAIYDPVSKRMIVFGGLAEGQPTDSTWQLTLGRSPAWSTLVTAGPLPSARFGHSAVYDPVRHRMIIFGGQVGKQALDDVWTLSLSDPPTWDSLVTSGPKPQARVYHTAIYDPLRDRVVIYGGGDPNSGLEDVWCLSLAPPTPQWEQPPISRPLPPPRLGHSAIYDPVRDRMIVFGGTSWTPNDTWALSFGDTSVWRELVPPWPTQLVRYGHAALYDSLRDRMIVCGGYSSDPYRSDVWELTFADTSWSPILNMGNSGSRRRFLTAVLDIAYDRAVIFGGNRDDSLQTWAFSLRSAMEWSPLRPVIRVSGEIELKTVTVGDTVSALLQISNGGLEPLQVTGFLLPKTSTGDSAGLRVGPPAPFELAWNESVVETLVLAARAPLQAQDSIVILCNDRLEPRRQVILKSNVLKLEFDVRVLGEPREVPLGKPIVVVVTPRRDVHVERGTLFFRAARGGGAFDAEMLTVLAQDLIAAIPAQKVTEYGIEYYVWVENSDSTARQPPPTAPDSVFTQAVAPPDTMYAVPRPTPGSDFLANRDIEVEIVLPEGAIFESGMIHFRRGGESGFESDSLAPHGFLGRPVGFIPARAVGPRGVEYRIEVMTLRDTLHYPDDAGGFDTVRTKVQDLAEEHTRSGGRYRILSVPLDFGSDFAGSLDALLTDQLGTYDPVRWRSFVYDPVSESNIEFSAAEASRFRPEPGRAFWLISREPHRIDTKPLSGYSTTTRRERAIPLAPGWNQFGNPFDFPVAWADVRRDSLMVGDPVAFDPSLGDYRDSVLILEPFEGYFVKAAGPATLWVPPREASRLPTRGTAAAGTSTPATQVPEGTWSLQLRALTPVAVDGSNVLGLHTDAVDGFDLLDQPEPPPPPGSWVQAAFVHADWGEWSGPYRRDLRSQGAEGQTWEIEVRSSTAGEPVTLEISGLQPSPVFTIRLHDRERNIPIDPLTSENGGIVLRHVIVSSGSRPYRLDIVAGTPEYVETHTASAAEIPARLVLDPPTPNPFQWASLVRFGLPRAGRVDVEVFNVQGQRVATPLRHAPFEAGPHSVVWDGRTDEGGPAPAGFYIVRVRAGGESRVGRALLIR